MLSTLVCLVIRCMRKGDHIEAEPEQQSVEHHDTEMSGRAAEQNSASDFVEEENPSVPIRSAPDGRSPEKSAQKVDPVF